MSNIKALVASLAPKMELQTGCQISEKKSGRGFVVQEPLKEQNTVAFISKRHMGKVITGGTISSSETFDNKTFAPNTAILKQPGIFVTGSIAPKVEVVQKPEFATWVKELSNPVVDLPNVVNLNKSISKVSNLIKDWLHVEDVFNQVKDNMKDKKMYAENFYTKIQNCIYHSLREYCRMSKDEQGNDILPVIVPGMECLPTLVFFDRMFNDKTISYEKAPNKVMEKYRKTFPDADGIQDGWVQFFKDRAKSKMPMDENGIVKVATIIMKEWGYRKYSAAILSNQPIPPTLDLSKAPIRLGEQEEETVLQYPISTNTSTMIQNLNTIHNDVEEYDGDDEDENDEYLTVSIIRDEDIDVVKIESSDGYGKVAIPFYTKLGNLPMDDIIPSVVDDRNGKWDWLIHFVPDLTFKTQNPDQYLEANDMDPTTNKIKCVIMDESDGTYIIGVYFVARITLFDGDEDGVEDFSDDTIEMINKLVNMEVASGFMSHLTRSLNDPEFFRDEEYILTHIMNSGCCDDDDEENIDGTLENLDGISLTVSKKILTDAYPSDTDDVATKAAIEAITGISATLEQTHPELDPEEDHQMDQSIASSNESQFDQDEESFTFVPIQKKQRLQD